MEETQDTSEFQFKGKHAEYVSKLTAELDTRTKYKIFQRNVDVLILAPIVGKLFNRTADIDNNNQIRPIKINYQQLTRESSKLDYNKELILLIDNKEHISIDERINRAFRYIYDNKTENKTKKDECEKIYMKYVLGGVEVLYEKLIQNGKDIDDFLDNMYNFIEELNDRYNEKQINDDDILELCNRTQNIQN